MRPVLIRDAEPGDYRALQRIFRDASLSNEGDRDGLLAHPEFLILDVDLIDRGRTRVAVVGDEIVGFATTSPAGEGVLELDDLFVDPDWQRHGAARALILHIRAESMLEAVSRIEVTANPHAMAFYTALGFEGDDPVQTELAQGVRMQLLIDPLT